MTPRWIFTIVLAIAGWLLLRHPAGAILGGLLGQAIDRGYFRTGSRPADDEDNPFAVLEVSPLATDIEVERAYRRLMSQHHPDRLTSVTPEAREQSERRAREINAAYDRIREIRRPKP